MGEVNFNTIKNFNFKCQIGSGYNFRHIIEHFKQLNINTGCFRITKDGIKFEESNVDYSVLVKFFLPASDLTLYKFDPSDGDTINLYFSIPALKDCLRHCGKKDFFSFYYSKERETQLFISFRKDNSSITNISLMNPTIDNTSIRKDFVFDENSKICTVGSSEFSKMCRNLFFTKSKFVKIMFFTNELVFKTDYSQGAAGHEESIGNPENENRGEKRGELTISMMIIRSLEKIQNLTTKCGTLQIYYSKNYQNIFKIFINSINASTIEIIIKGESKR